MWFVWKPRMTVSCIVNTTRRALWVTEKKRYSVTAACFRRRMWFVIAWCTKARSDDPTQSPNFLYGGLRVPRNAGNDRQFWLFLHDERKQPGWTGSHRRRCRTSSGESGTLPTGGGTQLRNEAENFSIASFRLFGFLTNASQFQVFPGVGNKLMAGVHHGSQSYDWTFRSSVQISAHTDNWFLLPRWPRYEGPEKKGT